MVTLARTTSGLLYRSDGTLTGWSGNAAWTSAADLAFIPFGGLPLAWLGPIESGQPGGEGFGSREGLLYAESPAWWIQYDSWSLADGTAPSMAPRMALSLDRGFNWVRYPRDSNYATDADGAALDGGSATGSLMKFGSTYYRTRVIEHSGSFGAGPTFYGNIGATPFQADLVSATALPNGPWTGLQVIAGTADTWTHTEVQPGSIVLAGTTYHLFISAQLSDGTATVGRFTSTSPGGPYTQNTDPDLTVPQSTGFSYENPRAFNHPGFGVFVLLQNRVNLAGQDTDSTYIGVTTDINDWSSVTWRNIQRPCPLDGNHVIGTMTHASGPGNAVITGPNGEVAATYDSDPSFWEEFGWHGGRRIRTTVLEPAQNCLKYAGSADTTTRSRSHALACTNVVIECASEVKAVNGSGGSLALDLTNGSGNGYRFSYAAGGAGSIARLTAGSPSTLATGSGAQVFDSDFMHRLKFSIQSGALSLWLEGELQATATDTTTTTFTTIALTGTGLDCKVWCLSARTSDVVTITGLTPGLGCYVRSYGGLPAGSVVANASGSGTFTIAHYPLWSLDIGGTDFTLTGDIWGGDTLAFSGLPASSGASLPRIAIF